MRIKLSSSVRMTYIGDGIERRYKDAFYLVFNWGLPLGLFLVAFQFRLIVRKNWDTMIFR
jgi:hypothetical protein